MLWHRETHINEPINYRGPGGDRTHDLQTEATPPAVSCPAQSLHVTEIVSKITIPVTCAMNRKIIVDPAGIKLMTPRLMKLWHTYMHACIHTYIHTNIFVVNFDPLAQASDIQIERRQVVFLCWRQDLNPGPQTPNRQQTECSLTNRLSYRGSCLKLELDSPSLWSASTQPTWPHCQLTFAPGSGDIHFVVVNFDALAQASDIQIERRQVVFLSWKQDLNPRSHTPNRQQTECSLTNRLSYRGSS